MFRKQRMRADKKVVHKTRQFSDPFLPMASSKCVLCTVRSTQHSQGTLGCVVQKRHKWKDLAVRPQPSHSRIEAFPGWRPNTWRPRFQSKNVQYQHDVSPKHPEPLPTQTGRSNPPIPQYTLLQTVGKTLRPFYKSHFA